MNVQRRTVVFSGGPEFLRASEVGEWKRRGKRDASCTRAVLLASAMRAKLPSLPHLPDSLATPDPVTHDGIHL